MSFVADPVDGIAILLWSADPDVPHRLATPFFHAAAAAAMDIPVEVYFTAGSVQLLVPGVAAGLKASARHDKTIADAMREAASFGALFFACSDALDAHGLAHAPLIAECTGHAGAVAFMERAARRSWKVLVY